MKKNVNPALTGAVFGLLIAAVYSASQLLGGGADIKKTLLTALGTGAVAGTFFALYIRSFTKRQAESFKSLKTRLESEGRVLFDAAANHLYSEEFVGGWLFLTENELYFSANPMNVLSHSVRIPVNEISDVRILKQMGFKSGIVVETDKKSESFSVSKPQKWIEEIKNTP